MKQYTPAIVNEIKRKSLLSFSRKYETRYYRGINEEQGLELLWLEMNALGKAQCYPCVLREGETVMAYRGGLKKENNAMIARWLQVIDASRKGEFAINTLEEDEFAQLYNEGKKLADKCEGYGALDDDEWTDEELLADEELAEEDYLEEEEPQEEEQQPQQ